LFRFKKQNYKVYLALKMEV